MAFSVDHHFLRTSHPRHGGPYLHKIALENAVSAQAISDELFHAVTIESLPPRVYELWLCACPDETATVLGLRQKVSVACRRSAINAFHRWFRTAKCVDIWRAVGGTEGIVTLLANFSVNHVKAFCKQLGRCNNSQTLRNERQDLITELMYALASRTFPGVAKVQNLDSRPLLDAYAMLVYACTPEARDAWIDAKSTPELDMAKVVQTDAPHFQQQCLKKAAAGDKNLWKYSDLFVAVPTGVTAEDRTVPKSLAFAAEILETLVENATKPADDVRGVGGIFIEIIHILARRKVSPDFALEMIDLISSCGKSHVVRQTQQYNVDYEDYLATIAYLWGHDPDAFEPVLSGLLQTSVGGIQPEMFPVLCTVAREKRYRLLRWLVSIHHKADIDVASQLTSLQSPIIADDVLLALPKPEARALIERMSVKEKSNGWIRQVGDHVPSPDLERSDVKLELLRCQLLDGDDARLTEATRLTKIHQQLAEKERDTYCRVGWVSASTVMAVSSGSLDLLKDVLLWARRFNRDPTISRFYGFGTVLRQDDTISLLSGIPKETTKDTDRATVEANIRVGNDIVLLLWETAAMCQKEPSFYASNWSEVQHLFVDIVQVRFERVKRLQSVLQLCHDDMYETIWKPTLEALLNAEKLGLNERNQALAFNTLGGPLTAWGSEDISIKNPSPSILRFIDELAVRRDSLWREHRPSVHPEIVTLQAPWPQGLPIQTLLAIDIEANLADESLPYIRERVKNVIFSPRETALLPIPKDKETQAAIGCFVDDYAEALKMYLSWCNEEERRARGKAAWKYATTELSEGRLSSLEAKAYWRNIFNMADVSLHASLLDFPERPNPILPQVESQDDVTEWNPDAGPHPANIEKRDLEHTFLDSVTPSTYSKDISTTFSNLRQRVVRPVEFPGFWDLDRFGKVIPPDVEEAYIAAGLLLMDALPQAGSKILSTGYPTGGNVRFPAVFLDSDFVEAQKEFDVLPDRLVKDTPPAILEQLTAALFAKIGASRDPSPEFVRRSFETLKLLVWSDRPELAIKHIVHVVIDLPEHSSWHRVMLHQGILKRLTAQQSKALVAGLADAIAEKSRQRPKASSEDAQKKVYVKVSTVKMLAQLVSHAEFVDEAFAVRMLGKLFKESTHIDIRTAVVESLIGVVTTTKDSHIEESVIVLLETDIVRVAAQLSERTSLTEQAWHECEQKGEMPEVDDVTPIRDALLEYAGGMRQRQSPSKIAELARRLVLPLVSQSRANRQRWNEAFLRANGASEQLSLQIPGALGSEDLLKKLLNNYTAHMPASSFHDLHSLTMSFAGPSQELHAFQERLNSTKDKPSGYETWHKSTEAASSLCTSLNIAQVLKSNIFATSEEADTHDLITTTHLQSHEKTVIDTMLANYTESATHWHQFTDGYAPPTRQREALQLAWQALCSPIVQYMVERIESLRSTAWQRDPERQPSRLPDAFSLRLWLLTYPSLPWRADAEYEARREKFAGELRDVVDELATSCIENGRPYHARFKLVLEAAKRCYEKDWALVAWRLGALEDGQLDWEVSLAKLLRVELADGLLQGAKQPVSEEVMRGVEGMLGQWRKCLDEEVIDRGIVTTEMLRENARTRKRDALPMSLE